MNPAWNQIEGEDRLATLLRNGRTRPVTGIPRQVADDLAPQSAVQRRMWLAQRLAADAPVNTTALLYRITGALDVPALDRALDKLHRRQAILRTSYTEGVQRVADPDSPRLDRLDLRRHDDPHRAATELAVASANHIPDLSEPSGATRFSLLQLGPDEHALLVGLHHISWDGWSEAVLQRELGELYAAEVVGRPANLPDLPVQYTDYAAWQAGTDHGDALDYWTGQLSGAASSLRLPWDRPPGTDSDNRGQHCSIPMTDLADGIRNLAGSLGVTEFAVSAAAFAVVLARCTRQTDLVLGIPVAGRSRPELEHLIGCFINTLPLRVRLGDDPPFHDLAVRIGRDTTVGLDWADVPFDAIVERLAPTREAGRQPLVQVVFQLHNTPADPLRLPGVTVRREQFFGPSAALDLALTVVTGDNGLAGDCEFRSDLFDRETVGGMLTAFHDVLAAALADPECSVSALGIPQPHRSIPPTAAPPAVADCDLRLSVPNRVAEWARTDPGTVAVRSADSALTYSDLDKRVTQLADALRRTGIGRGTPVGVCLEPAPHLPIAVLAVLKVGGCCVPLDPQLPTKVLHALAAASGAQVLLVSRAERGHFDASGPRLVTVDEPRGPALDDSAPAADGGPALDDRAFLCFPAEANEQSVAVAVTHRAVLDFVEAMCQEAPALTRADSVLASSPLRACSALHEMLLPLAAGAQLMLPSAEQADGEPAQASLKHLSGVTVAAAPAAQWSRSLTEDWSTARLRVAICTDGEPPARGLVEALRARAEQVWWIYGPPETFGWAVRRRLDDDPAGATLPHPTDGCSTLIVDPAYRPVPAGMPGELLLGGACSDAAYPTHPALTAASFIPDPLAAGPNGGRLLRTGMLARRRPDGALDVLGRTDARGNLDLNAVGPVPTSGGADAVDGPPTPAGPVYALVAEAWRSILGLAHVSPSDGFFSCGGHSLPAAEIASWLGSRLHLPTDQLLRELFRKPRLADYAEQVAEMMRDRPEATSAPIPPRDRSGSFILPRSQEQLWFLDQLDDTGGQYQIPLALRLVGPLDVAALRAALVGIVKRHDVLRTAVHSRDGRPLGAVQPESVFDLAIVDATDADPEELTALIAALTGVPMDLSTDLPIRASLFRASAQDHVLCLILHHIAFDGWSWRVFYEELAALYHGQTPAEPPHAFHDLAMHLDERPDEDGPAYWRDRLAGLTPVGMPLDHPRTDQAGEPITQVLRFPAPVLSALEQTAAEHNVTLFMLLSTACQILVRRHIGSTDVAIGTTVAERDHPAAAGVIGLFVNTLVLRANLAGNPAFDELLDRLREPVLADYAHQRTPFDRIVSELAPERGLSRIPFFEVLVTLDADAGARLPQLRDIEVSELPVPLGVTKFDVLFDFHRSEQSLSCLVAADSGLYDAESVRRWADRLVVLLASLAAHPSARIDDVPLIPEYEMTELRESAGPPDTDYPEACLHELFEAQAERTPDLPAVVDAFGELSYRELDILADRVAAGLRASGVHPESAVAVMLNRSNDLLAALLGLFKAGAGYVPLETDTPPTRLRTLLAGAGCTVCLVKPEFADLVREAGGTPMTVAELALADRGIQRTPGHPDQVCALYFTSGSTGTPKAVTCTHRGWVNRIWWMQRRHGLAAGETVLQKTTLTFDDAAVEMFWPLLAGGRVAMLEPGGHRDPRAILDGAARYRAVHINFVPGMLEMVLDAVRPEELPALSTLRSLVSCGDVLRPELVGRVFECFNGQVMLDNLWGATEVSIDSTWLQCGEDETRPTVSGAVCLGRPFDNNDVLVLDDEGRPVPPGVAGELCIGGVGLARGYHADPARTARTFVPHPHRPGERMYCTGDQGRRRTNGLIEFRGRRDDQVKVRGVRIELGEVDAALRAHPDVVDVAVIAWQAAPGDKRLAAYAVTRNRAATTAADLRRFASERLAVYAVPSSIALLDELPRLPSGKLDRRRLPAAEPDADRETGYQPPTGPAEEAIAAIWRDVLSLARVGRDDNFFTIGGHSLLAIRALTKTRQTFDLALPVSMMFDKPTVAAAAAHVEDLLRAEIAALTDDEVARLLPQEPAAG